MATDVYADSHRLLFEGTMKQVTEDVFVRDGHSLNDTYRGCTHGMVRTSDGVVLIDAPMVPNDAREWREAVRQHGEVTYLISTHHHLDHTAGSYFFDAEGIAHAETKSRFDDQSNLFSGSPDEADETGTEEDDNASTDAVTALREYVSQKVVQIDPSSLPLADDYRVTEPSLYISGEATLSVGDHTFELVPTPGHTRGDIGVYVSEEGVYFAGDTVTNGVYPSLASCLPFQWLNSLVQIQAMDVDVVVPGHGEAGDPAMVARFERFLRQYIEATAEATESGASDEAIVKALPVKEFPQPLHQGSERRRADVARIRARLDD